MCGEVKKEIFMNNFSSNDHLSKQRLCSDPNVKWLIETKAVQKHVSQLMTRKALTHRGIAALYFFICAKSPGSPPDTPRSALIPWVEQCITKRESVCVCVCVCVCGKFMRQPWWQCLRAWSRWLSCAPVGNCSDRGTRGMLNGAQTTGWGKRDGEETVPWRH